MNLAISVAADTLLIPEEDHSEVQKSVKKVYRQPQPRRTIKIASESTSSGTAPQGYAGSDDGRVVVKYNQSSKPREDRGGRPENEMQLCAIYNMCMSSFLNSKFSVNNLGKGQRNFVKTSVNCLRLVGYRFASDFSCLSFVYNVIVINPRFQKRKSREMGNGQRHRLY